MFCVTNFVWRWDGREDLNIACCKIVAIVNDYVCFQVSRVPHKLHSKEARKTRKGNKWMKSLIFCSQHMLLKAKNIADAPSYPFWTTCYWWYKHNVDLHTTSPVWFFRLLMFNYLDRYKACGKDALGIKHAFNLLLLLARKSSRKSYVLMFPETRISCRTLVIRILF
jgi:hypothetical protein